MDACKADILVVDDDPEVQDVVSAVLERDGYQVRTASSGEEGLATLEARTPDLLILDVMMPGMDGHEVCRRLKADPRWSTLPIIMITAKMDLEDVVQGLELGADDYVTKPFFYEELLARVRATLRATATERALAKKHRTLEALYAITQATTQSLRLETVLQEALRETCAVLKMDAGMIRLIDPETKEMVAVASEGVQIGVSLPERIPIRGGHEEVIRSGEPCVVPDTLSDPRTRDFELFAREGFRSAITIPLTVPGHVIGTLNVISRTSRVVEPEEIGFLKAVGLQIGVAVEHARFFEATQRQAQELSVLNRVASAVSSSIELGAVLKAALDYGVELTGAESGAIRLLDEERGELVLAAQAGRPLSTRNSRPRFPLSELLVPSGMLTQRVHRLKISSLAGPVAEGFAKENVDELLIVPLQARDRVVGIMGLFAGPHQPFRPCSDQFLYTLGHQIGVAVENALLHSSLRESETKYRHLLEEIPEVVYQAPRGPSGQLSFVSPAIEALTGYSVEDWCATPGLWASSIMAEDREPILSEFDWLLKHGGECQVEYRLLTKAGELRWVMDRAKGLRNELGAVVAVEGVIIDITHQKQSESQITRQNVELTLLNAVSWAVSQSLDLDEILRQALSLTVDSLGFDAGTMHLASHRPGEISLRAHYNLPPDLLPDLAHLDLRTFRTAGLAQYGEVGQSSLAGLPELQSLFNSGFCSLTSIPLVAKEEVVGYLFLLSRAPRELGEDERLFLRSIGQQIGLAIQNAQLYRETDQTLLARVRELVTLQAVSDIVSRSLKPKEILQGALERIISLTKIPIGVVLLLDPTAGRLVLQASHQISDLYDADLVSRLPLDSFPSGRAVLSGKPVIVEDLWDCPWLAAALQSFGKTEGHRSMIAVPIRTRGRILGACTLVSRELRQFPRAEIELLEAVGQQIGVAIENARLFEETRHLLQETQTLLTVSQLINSTLDPVEVLRLVSRETGRSLGADMVGAYLADPDESVLRPVAGYHVPKQLVEEFRAHPMPVKGHRILTEGWATERPVYASDSARDSRIDREWYERFPHRAVLFIPMMIRKEKTGGIFAVWWEQAPQLTPETLRLVEGISRQAAIAVENTRLYRAVSDQVGELQRLAHEVMEKSRAKEEFLMAISHELGTPLTAIKAYVDTLFRESALDLATRQSFLSVVKNEVDRLARMIGHVLDAARMEWGPLQLKVETLNLAAVAREVVRESSPRREVNFQGESTAWVSGDRDRLKQVLINLVDNAIKYSPIGRPVEVTVQRKGGEAVVSVRDHGMGVPPALRSVIFEKFKRAETGTTRETYGAGLGLYISRAIVEAHGGRIRVKSTPGQGSVFSVTLPATVPEQGAALS